MRVLRVLLLLFLLPNLVLAAGTHMFIDSDWDPILKRINGDGHANQVDNCPTVWNPGQRDRDQNDVGDACQCNVGTGADGLCSQGDIDVMNARQFTKGVPSQHVLDTRLIAATQQVDFQQGTCTQIGQPGCVLPWSIWPNIPLCSQDFAAEPQHYRWYQVDFQLAAPGSFMQVPDILALTTLRDLGSNPLKYADQDLSSIPGPFEADGSWCVGGHWPPIDPPLLNPWWTVNPNLVTTNYNVTGNVMTVDFLFSTIEITGGPVNGVMDPGNNYGQHWTTGVWNTQGNGYDPAADIDLSGDPGIDGKDLSDLLLQFTEAEDGAHRKTMAGLQYDGYTTQDAIRIQNVERDLIAGNLNVFFQSTYPREIFKAFVTNVDTGERLTVKCPDLADGVAIALMNPFGDVCDAAGTCFMACDVDSISGWDTNTLFIEFCPATEVDNDRGLCDAWAL